MQTDNTYIGTCTHLCIACLVSVLSWSNTCTVSWAQRTRHVQCIHMYICTKGQRHGITSSEREAPWLTSSYLMELGLMESTKSITGMELAMLGSLNPEIEVVFPAAARVSLAHSTISGSVMGLSDLARRCNTDSV